MAISTDEVNRSSAQRLDRLRAYTRASLLPGPALVASFGSLMLVSGPRPLAWSGGLALMVLTLCGASQVWLTRALRDDTPDAPEPARPAEVAAIGGGFLLLVAGTTIAAVTGPVEFTWSLLTGLLGSVAAMRLPAEHGRQAFLGAMLAIAAGCTVLTFTGRIEPGPVVVGGVIALLIIVTNWAQWWTYVVARRLATARAMAAELAITEERLRFAAELHDVQGHHLQVIMLQSELAARLAERDPTAAAGQMREVNAMARQALSDTRAVVGGYRRVSFETELANALRVLQAAGIAVDDATTTVGVDESTGELLGSVVREATTNVLRHSTAGHAGIELVSSAGRYRLRVHNDGVPNTPIPSGDRVEPGNGLRQLADRLAAAGGELTWEAGDGGFALAAELPVRHTGPE